MANSSKPVRKILLFGNDEQDRALWKAIESELEKGQHSSFNELCKTALHQFLLKQEPTQSVVLFIELEKQISNLQNRVMHLEEVGNSSIVERLESLESKLEQIDKKQLLEEDSAYSNTYETEDPLLTRLGPLLEAF